MNKTLFKSKSTKKTTKVFPPPVFGGFEPEGEHKHNERMRQLERIERKEVPQKIRQRTEFTVFAYSAYKEKKETRRKLEEVRRELILAINQMKKLNITMNSIEKVAYERLPDPGIYHINFFEKLIMLLKVLRKNIAESKNWLEMVFVKKNKRRYWNMAKRASSKFMLSHERRLATQAG